MAGAVPPPLTSRCGLAVQPARCAGGRGLSFFRSLQVPCVWCPVCPCLCVRRIRCFLCVVGSRFGRGAWLFVACCARSPGRVLRLRCEGGNLSPFGLLKGARRALVSTLLFALVITEFLHLSSLFLHVQHSHRSWMRAESNWEQFAGRLRNPRKSQPPPGGP